MKLLRAGIALLVWCLLFGGCYLGTDIEILRERVRDDKKDLDLTGTISISPSTNVTTGTELTATYSGSETVTLSYQWKRGTADVGTDSNKYTPAEAGSYTVTVSADGYKSKTSAAVAVTGETLETFTVTFNSGGGNAVPSQTVIKGAKATEPQSVTRSGYTLDGWYRDNTTFQNEWNFATDTVTANITLYAKWNQTAAGALELAGTVSISAEGNSFTINTELTATYSGSETVTYQWKKDGANVGTNSNKHTPTESGSYTVTVSATGYNPKTSAAVDVSDPSLPYLAGTVTISPNVGVETGTELTANYSGNEPVTYQWKKDGANVGTNSNKHTPTESGSYTVTVSATGYNSKTSAAVIVTVTVTVVTFDANGATGTAPAGQMANTGSSITLPGVGNLTRTGYTFGGWNTNASGTGTNYNTGESFTVTDDIILYAQWLPNTTGITLNIEQIIDGAPIIADITISRTNNGYPVTFPVSVNASDYDAGSINWEVAGVGAYAGQTVTGSGGSFTLDAAEVKYNSLGIHALTLTVTKDGQQYQKAIPFTIVQ